jgi:hypothetical protein
MKNKTPKINKKFLDYNVIGLKRIPLYMSLRGGLNETVKQVRNLFVVQARIA